MVCVTSPTIQLENQLGEYLKETHRKIRWSILDNSTEIYFVHDDTEEGALRYGVYERNEMAQTTRFGQRYSEQEVIISDPPLCNYASILHVTDGVVSLHSRLAIPIPEIQNTTFWSTLHSFPNQSIWRTFPCGGDGECIGDTMLN